MYRYRAARLMFVVALKMRYNKLTQHCLDYTDAHKSNIKHKS